MNRWIGIGRLTSKPELRYTASNIPFTRFTLAINRQFNGQDGTREADFINIITWRKQAENICNYLDKGNLVCIEGRMQVTQYDDKDGNRRYATDIVADNIQYLETKKREEPSLHNTRQDGIENDPFADFDESVSIDDNFLD